MKSPSSKSSAKPVNAQVRTYFTSLAPDSRRAAKTLRETIRAVAPRAVEAFSYGIPGFKLDGRPLIWYAAWKRHCSLYPMTGTIQQTYASEIEGYKVSKGTIQFPLDEPIPLPLVKKLVKARMRELHMP